MSHVDNPFINPRILSYCPGILGLERGLKRAVGSIRTAAYLEIEALICENLLAGMESGLVDAAPIWLNLKTFDAAPFRGAVDGIIGGYPCQPFSNAGDRKGTEDPRHLYPYLAQHINTIRPVWCFFENVSGHLTLGFPEVRESLSEMGYNVEAGIFTAEEVGAPHKRERLFILAIRRDWLQLAHGDHGRCLSGKSKQHTDERRVNAQHEFTESRGYELANAECCSGNTRTERPRWKERTNISWRSARTKMGNATSNDQQRDRLCERQCEIKVRRSGNNPFTVGLADSDYTGCKEQRQPVPAKQEQSAIEHVCIDHWPARPGEDQYGWEEPRTIITAPAARLLGGYGKKYPEGFQEWQIDQVAFNDFTGTVKPGMDSTIDGYNYREDLLRAAGNSVVEQSAELAFITLLKTHLKK